MKKFRIATLLLAAALVVSAIGSAALSTITFDRDVSAGQVLSDTNANVAVKFENISGYPAFMKTEANGEVSFDLNAIIKGLDTAGFNTDGQYTLGSEDAGLFTITNNTDVSINVSLTAASVGLVLLPVDGDSATISSGGSSSFYYTLDTDSHDAGTNLVGTLRIVED